MRYYLPADDLADVTRLRARQRQREAVGQLLVLLGFVLMAWELLKAY